MPLVSPRKLQESIKRAEERMRPLRKVRVSNLTEYDGQTQDGTTRIINLVQRNIDSLVPHLATFSPEHDVKTKYLPLRGQAAIRSLTLDHLSEEIDLRRTSRLAVLEACVGPKAVVRIGSRVGAEVVTIEGREYNKGQPYARLIDLDNYGSDPDAASREAMLYEYDWYAVPKQKLLDSGIFDPAVIERLAGAEVWRKMSERAEGLTNAQGDQPHSLIEMVAICDVFIYDDGVTHKVTIPWMSDVDDFLRVEEFEGPERGPYEWLEFHPIPRQPHGRPLASLLRAQGDAMNGVMAKVLAQVARTKKMLIGKRGSGDDLNMLLESTDGVTGEMDEPENVKEFDVGGISDAFLPFVGALMGWSNLPLGNVDMRQGNDTGGDKTATQSQNEMSQATVLIDDLQQTHGQFHNRIARQLAWHLDKDPLISKGMIQRLPGGEMIQVVYDAATREGDFEDYAYKIIPRSMMRQSPETRARRIIELFGAITQVTEAAVATGGYLKPDAAARILGREFQVYELDELIGDPMLMQEQAALMQALPQPGMGQPQGPSGVNPQAGYRVQPQGSQAAPGKTSNKGTNAMQVGRSAMASGVPA